MQVMAEGAKMARASQGTAQQRAFTQEGVKGERENAARILKWLTYLFNKGVHTRLSLKHTRIHTCSIHTRIHRVSEEVIKCLQSNLNTPGSFTAAGFSMQY